MEKPPKVVAWRKLCFFVGHKNPFMVYTITMSLVRVVKISSTSARFITTEVMFIIYSEP